jgi:glycerol uptake facilitator-like aquaporin
VNIGLALSGDMERRERFGFVTAQILGAVSGVVVANAVFGASWLAISGTSRSGLGQVSSELVVTFVLVLLIVGLVRSDRTGFIPAAVGAWIVAIIIASPSTGFANPAVTIARIVTDTVTGIAPGSAPAFLVAQVVGGLLGGLTAMSLFPSSRSLNDTTPDILEDAP